MIECVVTLWQIANTIYPLYTGELTISTCNAQSYLWILYRIDLFKPYSRCDRVILANVALPANILQKPISQNSNKIAHQYFKQRVNKSIVDTLFELTEPSLTNSQ